MPHNPEHRGRQSRPEPGGRRPEGQPLTYYLAASFPTSEDAQEPYTRAQKIIHLPAIDLSAFSFERRPRDPHMPPLARSWFVVVLGEQPPEPIEHQLQETLGRGEMTTLPLETIVTLAQRRAQETKKGSWVEEHHGAGIRIPEVTVTFRRKGKKEKRNQQKQSRRRNRGREH